MSNSVIEITQECNRLIDVLENDGCTEKLQAYVKELKADLAKAVVKLNEKYNTSEVMTESTLSVYKDECNYLAILLERFIKTDVLCARRVKWRSAVRILSSKYDGYWKKSIKENGYDVGCISNYTKIKDLTTRSKQVLFMLSEDEENFINTLSKNFGTD